MYRITLLLFALFLCNSISFAAFPLQKDNPAAVETLYVSQQAAPFNPSPAPQPYGYNKGKSQALAIILCALLGATGAHNFYLGYWGQGLAQLLMSVLIVSIVASGTGFGALLLAIPIVLGLGIWLLVELILICVKAKLPKRGNYR